MIPFHPNPNNPSFFAVRVSDQWAVTCMPSIYTSRCNATRCLFDVAVEIPTSGTGSPGIDLFPPMEYDGKAYSVATKTVARYCAESMEATLNPTRPIPVEVQTAVLFMAEFAKAKSWTGDQCDAK